MQTLLLYDFQLLKCELVDSYKELIFKELIVARWGVDCFTNCIDRAKKHIQSSCGVIQRVLKISELRQLFQFTTDVFVLKNKLNEK